MSRIPQVPSSRNTARTPGKTSTSSSSRAGTVSAARKPPSSPTPSAGRTLRPQASLTSVKPPPSPQKSPLRRPMKHLEDDCTASAKAPPVSIREQIALRRAEAKKATTKGSIGANSLDDFTGLEEALPHRSSTPDDSVLDLGRWSVKETIERARSTGAINLASRSLPCLPSALFEIHLGITPEPLNSVPSEPPITTSSVDEPSASRRRGANHDAPSWYEAQDLEILKAWSNEILEIQPEISMFGSLKTIDLHNNKLTTVPGSFADLTALASLDLSHNEINTLPANVWALPNLTSLNLSHNALVSLPFFCPFAAADSNPLSRTRDPRGDWYSESITRATIPLPKLSFLDVSNNRLTAASIDHGPGQLPASLSKLNLSSNPLGNAASLIKALSLLTRLTEIVAEHSNIEDESFPVGLLSQSDSHFPALSVFDLGETGVTRPAAEAFFLPAVLTRNVEFEFTTEPPKPGVLRVLVGKRVIKEAWELEAERRTKTRGRLLSQTEPSRPAASEDPTATQAAKEPWELEATQGLFTEGARRRARAAAAASSVAAVSPDVASAPTSSSPAKALTKATEKEAWEVEAEQGLLTAGGRRRARAAAMAAAALSLSPSPSQTPSPSSTPATSPIPSASALSNPQYYSAGTQTLTLPPSAALSKVLHTRSFSLAAKMTSSVSNTSELALTIPTPTLPLAAIVAQPLSYTLRTLILSGRRMDPYFSLPADTDGPLLPQLEELSLENCNLGDKVSVSRTQQDDGVALQRTNEDLLTLLARLFPSMRTLDLSYNSLTSASISTTALIHLILTDPENARVGLRHLRLRGNRLTSLDGFEGLAGKFKGNRTVPHWKLEELDLRDNEVGRLPPEIGLLPMDVFLVDGNVFRVPARRVWEREGTKGLLSWLRGRIE